MPVVEPLVESSVGPNPLTEIEQVVLRRQLRRAARHPDEAVSQPARDTLNDPDMFLVMSQKVAAEAPPSPTPKQHPFLQWLLSALPTIISWLISAFGGGKIPPLPPLPPFPPLPPAPPASLPAGSGGDMPPPFNPVGELVEHEAVGLAIPPFLMTMFAQALLSIVQKAAPEIAAKLPAIEAALEEWIKTKLGG